MELVRMTVLPDVPVSGCSMADALGTFCNGLLSCAATDCAAKKTETRGLQKRKRHFIRCNPVLETVGAIKGDAVLLIIA